jgi:geranylgeranyl pyrophosphate synthase
MIPAIHCGRLAIRRGARVASFNTIERVVGQFAADHFIDSMTLNSKLIDTPLVSIGDPAKVDSWEWSTCLDSTPHQSLEQLLTKVNAKSAPDPFELVKKDVCSLSGGSKELLGSDHPVLESCAKYFFETDGGKKIRPTMVLAVSYALNAQSSSGSISSEKDRSHGPPHGDRGDSRLGGVRGLSGSEALDLYATPSQKRLAEITEMIHTASLFHDDVIDKATTRRGSPSVNQVFGNKLAILGGDFLLSRASVSLARLRNLEVVELLSTVIEHLVKGEIMQMKPASSGKSALEYYLRKNYYKTASLMGHSCLAAAVLGGYGDECKRACYLYGTYVGQAFQLIDDALDFEGSTASLGKAPLADLTSGLATAPTLFAAEEHPQLLTLIGRKFEYPGDVDEALRLVQQSDGLKRCKDLAQVHVERAIEAIQVLEPSPARDSLVALACKVVNRTY